MVPGVPPDTSSSRLKKAGEDARDKSKMSAVPAAAATTPKPLKSALRRSHWSTPDVPSAMRVPTLDESLHSADLNRSRSRGKPAIDELALSRSGGRRRRQQNGAANGDAGVDGDGDGDADGDDADASLSSSRLSVLSFSNVEFREYSRAVGDNPSVSAGPPLSIGWEYNPPDVLSVDEYESTRPPRRAHHEMVVPRSVRQDMLMHDWGYSRSALANAVRESNRTKTQRRTTVNNLDTPFSRMEEGAQSAKRKVKRLLLRRKSDGAMYERWKVQERKARAMIEAEYLAAAAAEEEDEAEAEGGPDASAASVPAAAGVVGPRGGGRGGEEEAKAEVEAEGGRPTFEFIGIDSPSDGGGGRKLAAPRAPPSPRVEEADRAASRPPGGGSSSSSQSRPPAIAAREDGDPEVEAALSAATGGGGGGSSYPPQN